MEFDRSKRVWLAGIALLLVVLAGASLGWRYLYPPTKFDPERLAAYYSALQPLPSNPVDNAVVAAAARSAAGYIRRANDAAGRFEYIVNLDPEVKVVRDYSILRHEGTVYSLGMYDDLFPDLANVEVMRRAVNFMRQCCYVELDGGAQIAINEPDFVAKPAGRTSLKLGGAGLGLLALTALERKAPGSVTSEEMQKISAFGQSLMRWNGAFYALYSTKSGGPTALEKSLYYPGEMAKGWVALYEIHPEANDEVDAALKGLMYLARTRARAGSAPADHWALLATARLFKAADKNGRKIPREALINHALQVCHAMLEEARIPQPIPAMEGSLAPMGGVTPTATRLEGMLAALTFLPPDHPIVPHIRAASDRGIDFLVRSQVKEVQYKGGMPRAGARLPDAGRKETREFNAQATEIRIDYVQHSLSAMVQYLQRGRE
ncbi:MAG: hypothetical protein MUO39_08270 [Steroidobacteraceae bacterium]|nr:hypothetical protein [Steroidobacteraceae bacterium]